MNIPGYGAMGLKASDYRAVPLCGGPEGHHVGRGTASFPGSAHTSGRFFLQGKDTEGEIVRLNAIFFGLS